MTITKLEDSENHKNAFEISGIDHKYFYVYYFLEDMPFWTLNAISEQMEKLFHCEGDQALAGKLLFTACLRQLTNGPCVGFSPVFLYFNEWRQ